MTHKRNVEQMRTIALATVPAFLTVLVGILINDGRLCDLRAYRDSRFLAVDTRFMDIARVHEANFKLLLSGIEDIDSRLTGLEERFAR